MGWISERHMRRGGSLYSGGPKRKGPLKTVVGVLHFAENMFGSNTVLLECGHIGRSYGGKRAVCSKCLEGKPIDKDNPFEIDVEESIKRWKKDKNL